MSQETLLFHIPFRSLCFPSKDIQVKVWLGVFSLITILPLGISSYWNLCCLIIGVYSLSLKMFEAIYISCTVASYVQCLPDEVYLLCAYVYMTMWMWIVSFASALHFLWINTCCVTRGLNLCQWKLYDCAISFRPDKLYEIQHEFSEARNVLYWHWK